VELNSQSAEQIPVVVASYVVMLLYASIALGRYSGSRGLEAASDVPSNLSTTGEIVEEDQNDNAESQKGSLVTSFIVNSRFSLSVSGIAIVLSSISCSVGIFSYMGFKATLIIAEVIPFLVLAVG
jgi:Niemann-Pick C1 protein